MDGSPRLETGFDAPRAASRQPAWLAALRSGGAFSQTLVLRAAGLLLALETIGLLFLIAGTHGWIVTLKAPTTTDFASFYAAGHLAAAGHPALAYDQAAHLAAEEQATAPGIQYQFFYYPPVFLLICTLLAHLPYLAAFMVFEAASLLLYLLVGQRILSIKGWAAALPLLAFPSVFWTLGLGQNAFLTAALLGSALLLIDRRPATSGLLFGLLCYKPHFGLLIPVALAAGRHWRAFTAAALSAGAVVLLSLLLFGWDTWRDFLALASGSHGTYESGRIDFSGLVTVFGGIRLLGGSTSLAYGMQALGTLTAIALVALLWHRRASLPLRAAGLAAATLIAVPVALVYDFIVAGIAIAFLVRAGRERGFLPWEQLVLALAFLTPLLSRSFGVATHLPLAPLAVIAVLCLVMRRARRESAQQAESLTTA